MSRIIKMIGWLVGIIALICIAIMLICNQLVASNAEGKNSSNMDSLKYNTFGLLLGTTPQARITKVKNYFFIYRLDAAEELYNAGKIDKILISGDENSLDGINEPECMRDSLVARGVPASDIILDGKGYRTINSIINANKVFGLKSFTIISQKFHNERAIYQAEHLQLDVENLQAYNAKMPKSRRAFLTTIREYFARVKLFVDLCFSDNEELYQQNSGGQKKWKSVPCPSRIPKEVVDSLKELRYEKDSFVVSYKSNPQSYATIGDIPTPEGFKRLDGKDQSYTKFLRSLPLKPMFQI